MSAAGVPAPPADPMATCTPLPDTIGPVFAKELRQGLRAHRFVLPFVAAQLIALVAIGSELAIASAFDGTASGFGGLVLTVIVIAVGIVMPLTNIGALRPELGDGRNIELLLMSNLDRWQIVRGKWLVGFALAMLMLVSLLPYLLARYFAGGVELMDYLFTLIGVVIGSGLLTGIAVGASGFGNLLGRFFLIGVGLFSAWGSIMAAGWRFFEKTASATAGDGFWPGLASIVVSTLVAALYVAYGLQLGRARLRLFENPIDPPASGLIIALIIFTPIVTGIATAVTAGWGAWAAVAGLLGLALSIDRGPGRDAGRAVYLQP